jgi:hypothetical protein
MAAYRLTYSYSACVTNSLLGNKLTHTYVSLKENRRKNRSIVYYEAVEGSESGAAFEDRSTARLSFKQWLI